MWTSKGKTIQHPSIHWINKGKNMQLSALLVVSFAVIVSAQDAPQTTSPVWLSWDGLHIQGSRGSQVLVGWIPWKIVNVLTRNGVEVNVGVQGVTVEGTNGGLGHTRVTLIHGVDVNNGAGRSALVNPIVGVRTDRPDGRSVSVGWTGVHVTQGTPVNGAASVNVNGRGSTNGQGNGRVELPSTPSVTVSTGNTGSGSASVNVGSNGNAGASLDIPDVPAELANAGDALRVGNGNARVNINA